MSFPDYLRASSREDLSHWVLHLVRTPNGWNTLTQILDGGQGVLPSVAKSITRYHPEGAACFYDCPPQLWPSLVCTNSSGRCAFGLIVQKRALWYLGGRPAIYTDIADPTAWPASERFRVIRTDLSRDPMPVDWMHEREWRIPNGLSLRLTCLYDWWWPLVPDAQCAALVFARYHGIHSVYQLDLHRTVWRTVGA